MYVIHSATIKALDTLVSVTALETVMDHELDLGTNSGISFKRAQKKNFLYSELIHHQPVKPQRQYLPPLLHLPFLPTPPEAPADTSPALCTYLREVDDPSSASQMQQNIPQTRQ